MRVEATTRLTRLTERLAALREEEWRRQQELISVVPYSPDHIGAHGRWTRVRGQIEEVEREIEHEKGN